MASGERLRTNVCEPLLAPNMAGKPSMHTPQTFSQPQTGLSDYKLSDTEQFVFSHQLSFCLPLTNVKREEVLADFEELYAQLVHHKPWSEEQLAALKARLSDLAHAYCGSPIDLEDILMTKECFKSIRINEEILITKPDKGLAQMVGAFSQPAA